MPLRRALDDAGGNQGALDVRTPGLPGGIRVGVGKALQPSGEALMRLPVGLERGGEGLGSRE
eukprot:1995843-Alexandrium_andersonii.AAC.1